MFLLLLLNSYVLQRFFFSSDKSKSLQKLLIEMKEIDNFLESPPI